jgi:hypothetical protein
MASYWPFGHLSPKLWAKEGPRVKLAVWLPTTKSQESTRARCPIQECDTSLERSRRGLQLRFRLCRDSRSGRGVMTSQSLGSPKPGHLVRFRDSNLGVPGKKATWMWVRWSVAEYTIWGMVVASPESGPWWVLCVKVPVVVLTLKGVPECELTTWVVCFDADSCLIY